MNNKARTQEAVLQGLRAFGWSASNGAAVATKSYPTIVGPKEAQVYLQDFGPNSKDYHLAGMYWSEGRNCLEPHPVAIPKTALQTDVVRLVAQFAQEADAVVLQTYAARLLSQCC